MCESFWRELPRWRQWQRTHLPLQETKRHTFRPWAGKILWRRAWQLTPVFLPGKSCGQRSLAGYSPQGHKELDMTDDQYARSRQSRKTWLDCWAILCAHLKISVNLQTFLITSQLVSWTQNHLGNSLGKALIRTLKSRDGKYLAHIYCVYLFCVHW